MGADSLVMRSRGHSEALLAYLANLREHHLLTDLVINLDDGVRYKVHKVVMVAFSRYFKAQLDTGQLDDGYNTLEGVDGEAFGLLLTYFYTGSLEMTPTTVLSILSVATQLDMPEACDLCHRYLTLSRDVETVVQVKQEPGEDGPSGFDGRNLPNIDMVQGSPELKRSRKRRKSTKPRKSCKRRKRVARSDHGVFQRSGTGVKSEQVDRRKEEEEMLSTENDEGGTDSDREWIPDHRRKGGRGRGGGHNQSAPLKVRLRLRSRKSSREHSRRQTGLPRSTSRRRKISKRGFKCDICHKKFSYFSVLSLHKAQHKKLWYRNTTSDIAKQHAIYRSLQKAWNRNQKQPKCQICSKAFHCFSQLSKHLKDTHFSQKCSKCQTRFLSVKAVQQHKLFMHQVDEHCERTSRSQCVACLRPFLYKTNFLQHIQSNHNPTEICLNCQKPYKNMRSLQKHLILCYLRDNSSKQIFAQFHCPGCQRSFKYRRPYVKHVRRCTGDELDDDEDERVTQARNAKTSKSRNSTSCPSGKSQWSCDQEGCSEGFTNLKRLEEHVERNHPEVAYSCSECVYTTKVKRLLKRHLRSRHKNKQEMCDVCGKTFSKYSRLCFHKYSKHRIQDKNVKVIHCPMEGCNYSCIFSSGLQAHMKRHNNTKQFSCEICGRIMKHQQSLEKHIDKVHRGIRPFMCDICGQAYGEEAELRAHIVRHSGTKQFQCNHCDYATHDKGNYQTHLYGVHRVLMRSDQAIFTCSICDFTTDRKHRYEMHMKKHLGIRDIICQVCGKTFVTRNSLANHMQRLHSGKTYACQFCSYTTGNVQHYREHDRVMHTQRNVKPYKCAYCDFRCHTSGNCRKHCANKHKGLEIKWVRLCELYKGGPGLQEDTVRDSNTPLATSSMRHQAVYRRISHDTPASSQPQEQEQLMMPQGPQQVYTQPIPTAQTLANTQPFCENSRGPPNPSMAHNILSLLTTPGYHGNGTPNEPFNYSNYS